MSLSNAAEALRGTLIGQDVVFEGVSTDTRALQPKELFVALAGPNYDGHNFLAEAVRAGAAGALLHRDVNTALPYIKVENTRTALGHLAAYWRRHFAIPVIGVTGSNGKTTVKEMIAAILGGLGSGVVTRGNLNNDIGVPLTLLRLRKRDKYAVIEMGMNHRGEIYYLSDIARPTIALITNAGEAHLAGLGSVEEVARAKGEIFSGLSSDGVAVINADDRFADLWRGMVGDRPCLSFGLDTRADVTAEYELSTSGSRILLKTTQGEIDMRLPLLGKHNVNNALAASATSLAAGATLADIKTGLEKLRGIAGRLEVKTGINSARILDDTYNANPSSLSVGLEVLKSAVGERVLVLGDMAELGDAAAAIHRRVGELAKRVGVSRLFALGELSREAAQSFGRGAKHFDSHQALIEDLIDCLHSEMTVLVKGSRIMHMERVVDGVVSRRESGEGR